MGKAAYAQTSFLGGEWSKVAQGRFEDPAYKTGMDTCRNGLPIETGAWNRRSGTLHVAPTKDGAPSRAVKFDFDTAQPYNLIFSDLFLRFQKGPVLATTNDAQLISTITDDGSGTVKITTAAAHGWSTGDYIQLASLGTSCAKLQNRQFKITKTSATAFTIADTTTVPGTTTNEAYAASYASFTAGATVSRIQQVTTPYQTSDWKDLRLVQASVQQNGQLEDLGILLRNSVSTRVLSISTEPEGVTDAQFAISTAFFTDGPYLDPVGGGALITPSALNGNVTMTINFTAYDATKSYKVGDFVSYSAVNYISIADQNLNHQPDISASQWTATSPGTAIGANGFQGTDIGRSMRFFSEPPDWVTGTTYAIGNVVKFNGSYWTALMAMVGATPASGNINPNQPGNLATTWAINAAGAKWTWGKIISFASAVTGGNSTVGDLTGGGGIAAAFDGNVNQTTATGAFATGASQSWGRNSSRTQKRYVGKDYSAGTKTIGSAVVYPATDLGFVSESGAAFATKAGKHRWYNPSFTWNLRAKHSLPANSADGTLLATLTQAVTDQPGGTSTSSADIYDSGLYPFRSPITLTSNDTATAWEYVWIELSFTVSWTDHTSEASTTTQTIDIGVADVQFYSPSGSSGASAVVQILGDPLLYTTALSIWRMGLYSDTTGYPDVGAYHEGRLVLSSSAFKNRFDASKSNDIFNFAPTAPSGAVADSNAISYTFNSKDKNSIVWMEPDLQGLIMGTLAGEWLVQATTLNSPLTPTSIQAHRHTRIRCADVEPCRTDHTLVLVQANKRRLMEYFADVFSGKFSAPNLSLRASHLSTSGIARIDYQQDLMPVVWALMTDGSLTGLSYKRDSLMSSQGPTFAGWHRHDLGSGRSISSLCVGPSVGGDIETLTLITNDPNGGPSHVEIMCDLWEETDALVNAQFLDDAVIPTSYVLNVTSNVATGVTLYGLWHMVGNSVSVFGAGYDLGDFTVAADGSVTVPFGDAVQAGTAAGAFTAALVASFDNCPFLVGYTFISQGQLLRPVLLEQAGSRTGPALGMIKRMATFAAMLVGTVTRALNFGGLLSTVRAAMLKSPGQRELGPNMLYAGIHVNTIDDDGTGYGNGIAWQITRPLPAIIPALQAFVETAER